MRKFFNFIRWKLLFSYMLAYTAGLIVSHLESGILWFSIIFISALLHAQLLAPMDRDALRWRAHLFLEKLKNEREPSNEE